MDGAFSQAGVIGVLGAEGVGYAVKVPFRPWLGLKDRIVESRHWERVDERWSVCHRRLAVRAWSRRMRVVVYRNWVRHRMAKNYQLGLFDPDDGYFDYSAIVTNKKMNGRTLWFFVCGRGTHVRARHPKEGMR